MEKGFDKSFDHHCNGSQSPFGLLTDWDSWPT